jgi:hypothetical protein
VAVANPGATSIVKNIKFENSLVIAIASSLTWLFQLDKYCGANPGATEDNKVCFTGTLLRGQAAAWWRGIGQTAQLPTTWQAFAHELKGMFMPLARSRVARQKLACARQHDSEIVCSYVNYLLRLLAFSRINEEEKVARLVEGLNPSLRHKMVEKLDERKKHNAETKFGEVSALAARYEATQPRKGQDFPSYDREVSTRQAPMELGALANRGSDAKDRRKNHERKGPPPWTPKLFGRYLGPDTVIL